MAEPVLRTRSPRTQRRDSPCSRGAYSLHIDRDCIRRHYTLKYKHKPVRRSPGQTPAARLGRESAEGSWTEGDLVYLGSILFCENWSMENRYMFPEEARTLAGENVRKLKEAKRLETRKGSGGEAQNAGVKAPPHCSSHGLCVCTPPGAADSLPKEGALSLDGHIRKFFLIPGCFWATLDQLATSTVLAWEVNTALGTERALISLPTPSPVTPTSCNQSPFTDLPPSLDTPPPSQPLAFLESEATFPRLWAFFPQRSSQEWI